MSQSSQPWCWAAIDPWSGEAFPDLDQHRDVRGTGDAEGLGDGGQVFNPARWLDAAGGRHHRGGGRVPDAGGKFLGRKTAEDHGVHGAEPGGCQHRDSGLGNHRHVDHHAVALADPAPAQDTGKPGHELREFGIAVPLVRAEHGEVVDQRVLRAPALRHVPVQRVIAVFRTPSGNHS